VQLYTEQEVKEARENDVDLLEEARELALARAAIYQQNHAREHIKQSVIQFFYVDDLLYESLRLVNSEKHMKILPSTQL
jgi:hypothetical protein